MKQSIIVKIILASSIILVLSIYLPDIFWSTFKFKIIRPRVSYSPIINDILISNWDGNVSAALNKNVVYSDRKGNKYTRDEYEAIMPQINFAQLVFSGKMPDSINGTAVDVPLLRKNLFMSTFEPYIINRFFWKWLPLIESDPGRVNLEFPNEFFRIRESMEIVDCRTNQINYEMSKEFSDELNAKGFSFPAKKLFGNPTTRKAFDEGYFIIDDADNLFHLKRVKNKPYCKKINLPAGMKLAHFNVHEIPLKEFYGFFVTEDNGLYLLTFNDYRIIKLDIEDYDLNNSTLRINGDLFNRTISVVNENKFSTFIFDRQYNLIENYKGQVSGKDDSPQGRIAAYLFPFSLSLISDKSMFVNFIFKFSDQRFLLINILLTIALTAYFYYKKISPIKNYLPLILIFLTGIYGLISVIIIRDFHIGNYSN